MINKYLRPSVGKWKAKIQKEKEKNINEEENLSRNVKGCTLRRKEALRISSSIEQISCQSSYQLTRPLPALRNIYLELLQYSA